MGWLTRTGGPQGGAHASMRTWDPEEDDICLAILDTSGKTWKQCVKELASFGYSRTTASVRNRYGRIAKAKREHEEGKAHKNRCKACGLPKKGHTCRAKYGRGSQMAGVSYNDEELTQGMESLEEYVPLPVLPLTIAVLPKERIVDREETVIALSPADAAVATPASSARTKMKLPVTRRVRMRSRAPLSILLSDKASMKDNRVNLGNRESATVQAPREDTRFSVFEEGLGEPLPPLLPTMDLSFCALLEEGLGEPLPPLLPTMDLSFCALLEEGLGEPLPPLLPTMDLSFCALLEEGLGEPLPPLPPTESLILSFSVALGDTPLAEPEPPRSAHFAFTSTALAAAAFSTAASTALATAATLSAAAFPTSSRTSTTVSAPFTSSFPVIAAALPSPPPEEPPVLSATSLSFNSRLAYLEALLQEP